MLRLGYRFHTEEGTMLIDRYLPRYDVTEVHEVEVDARADQTYAAIQRTNLRDPIIDTLFAVRELPNRIARKLQHEPVLPGAPAITFADMAQPELGWVPLAEEPGSEFVLGSVGRFWRRDYGWRTVPAAAFARFNEPGFAKIAISFSVWPKGFGSTVVRYETRTATTDKAAQIRFRPYWLLVRPGVALVMRRALARIKAEAERTQQPSIGAAR